MSTIVTTIENRMRLIIIMIAGQDFSHPLARDFAVPHFFGFTRLITLPCFSHGRSRHSHDRSLDTVEA